LATLVAEPHQSVRPIPGLPGRRYDHYFFSIMALLMLVSVFIGFARSYFLAGVFRAPLPSPIVHIHGAAFTAWILLLVTQTSLVAAGRTDIHRRLGIAGFLLGCLMVILGVLASTDSLIRHAGQLDPFGRDPQAFYLVPMSDMLLFATFIYLAFRNRKDCPAHKRYIYIATTALMVAAIARWPLAFVSRNVLAASLVSELFLLFLIAYDLWSIRKIHRATLWAGAMLIVVEQIRLPLGKTALWHSFANWVITHSR
jgi:FtsH-binding integral membrane protein